MMSLLLSLAAGLTVVILVLTLMWRHEVSAYARTVAQGDSFVRARVSGFYDKWDRKYRDAGLVPNSPTHIGNLVLITYGALFIPFFFLMGPLPALVLAALPGLGIFAYLSMKTRKRSKNIEPVIIDFIGVLASKTTFMSMREAFTASVNDSNEPLIHELLGTAVAALNTGSSMHSALISVAQSTSNEGLTEMCAELDAAGEEGGRRTAAILNRLRDGLLEREMQRQEAMANDVLMKAMIRIFLIAPSAALAFSILMTPQAWNNIYGFVIAAIIIGGIVAAQRVFARMLIWRMDY
jgi:hypothetical protein